MQRFVIKRQHKYVIYDLKKKKAVDTALTKDIAQGKLKFYIKKFGKVF